MYTEAYGICILQVIQYVLERLSRFLWDSSEYAGVHGTTQAPHAGYQQVGIIPFALEVLTGYKSSIYT